MAKKKVKKKVFYVFGLMLLVVIGVTTFISYQKYISSSKYKLIQLGYNEQEITTALKSNTIVEKLLSFDDYQPNVIKIMTAKYYLNDNLERYQQYLNKNSKEKIDNVIAIVNVGADREWYDRIKATDTSKGNLMLVNKFNYLTDNYEIEDLVKISTRYAFANKEIKKEVNDEFINMVSAAKEEGLTIVANSSYRDFLYQDKLYKSYKTQRGLAYADSYAARAGHSEHQPGLAIDVSTLKSTMEDFEETKECAWLKKNAYKYGFILRYPKDKTYLTGYNYESWHYRYVGLDVAIKIKEENITFDEYYAFYVEGKNE